MSTILQYTERGDFLAGDFTAGEFLISSPAYVPWIPAWRVRMQMQSVWRYFATRNLDSDETHAYEGYIAEGREPSITRRMTDAVYRMQETQSTRFGLANRFDGTTSTFNAAYVADLRGAPIEVERWDEATGYTLSRFVGTVTDAWLDDDAQTLEIEAKNLKRDVLDDLVPKLTITTTLFPDARPEAVGNVIRIVHGIATNVPLFCIRDDMPGSRFDYLAPLAIGGGAITVNALKRRVPGSPDFYLIGAGEYTVSTTEFPGYTTIRFAVRQQQWGGTNLLEIWGDFSCVNTNDRNPALARQAILANTSWGLSQTVDAASFSAAAVACNAVTPAPLVVDGVLDEQKSAHEWLTQLGMVRGLMLGLSIDGAWTESVDTPRTVTLTLRDGPGDGVRNLAACTERKRRPNADRIKRVLLRYAYDATDSIYKAEQIETTDTVGRDLVIEARSIRDHTTGKQTLQYLAGRIRWGEETARATALQDIRAADIAALASLTYAPQSWASAVMEVLNVNDRLTTIGLDLQGGSQALYDAIYTYTPGTLPTSPGGGFATDYTKTVPNAAQDANFVAVGTSRNAAGQDIAWVRMSVVVPTTNCSGVIPRYRRTGTTEWIALGQIHATGTVNVVFDNLITGAFYDFSFQTVNEPGNLTSTPVVEGEDVRSNVQVSVDPTAPAVVTGLVVTPGTGSALSLDWDDVADIDLDEYFVYRNTVDSGWPTAPTWSTTLLIAKVKASRFVDLNVSQGTQYFYRVGAEDFSSNRAALSATANNTPTGTAQGTAPSAPAIPTFSTPNGGTQQGSDGMTWAYANVIPPAMPLGGAVLELLARENNGPNWTTVAQFTGTPGTTFAQVRIDGGVPGQEYDVAARAFNAFGMPSALSPVLDVTAAGDATIPADVTAIVVRQTGARVLEIVPTAIRPNDFKAFRYWVSTTNSFTSPAPTQITPDVAGPLVYQNVSAAVTYYFWAKMVDHTGNVSVLPSPSSGHSITVRRIEGSLGSFDISTVGTIGTIDVGNSQITTAKRQVVNSQSAAWTQATAHPWGNSYGPYSWGAVGSPIPLMTVDSGHAAALGIVAQMNAGTATFYASLYIPLTSGLSGTFTVYFW